MLKQERILVNVINNETHLLYSVLCYEEGQPNYNKNELLVILGGLSLIAGTFLVGLIPMVFLYVLFWLKVIEKGTPWKDIIIIELIVAVIVLGVFAGWLQVQFPWGMFDMLR